MDFGYTISNADLPQPTTAALYWAPDKTFNADQDTLIKGSVTDTQTAQTPPNTSVPIHVSAAVLQGTPVRWGPSICSPSSTHPAPTTSRNPTSWTARTRTIRRSFSCPSAVIPPVASRSRDNLGFQANRRRWCGFHVRDYWGRPAPARTHRTLLGQGADPVRQARGALITEDDFGNPLMTETAQGVYDTPIHVSAARLDTPPAGTTNLIVVLDPPDDQNPSGMITETREDDNTKPLGASAADILANSVHYTFNRPKNGEIDATFMPVEGANPPSPDKPGQSALLISQAEARSGVTSFDWIQTVTYPKNWTTYSSDLTSNEYYLQEGYAIPIQSVRDNDPNEIPSIETPWSH